MRMLSIGLLLWGVTLLTGCTARASGPEPLPVDRVNCARCGMLISSDANSAEALAPDTETRFYDDIGCLASDRSAAGPDTDALRSLG